ncbi:MAG: TlpA family protein disulfide reductase [Burkholderiales bacterium]|jgi:peroxiredoxin|nr:MAG: TlpA family protein disulfide reductase [Burkholderiales bacterium]
MIRRAWLMMATGGLAALLGIGIHWWRTEPAPAGREATAALFAASFPDAEGRLQSLAQWRGRPLLVNFWATWCPPCVEEMPELQRVRDAYLARGVEVIGIGIDNAARIAAFRDRHRLTLPLLVAGVGGSELNRTLGNAGGALPYTVLIDADGRIRERHLGQVRPAQLRRWLESTLPPG